MGLLLIVPLFLFGVSLSDFAGRYLIVQFPLLFLLPAIFVVRGLKGSRWRQPVLALIILTTVFNVVFSPAYYHYQSVSIAHGDVFMPSFRKMESIRRKLKADAGPETLIRIDASSFCKSSPKMYAEDIGHLVDYIALREQYDPLVRQNGPARTYEVRAAADPVEANERVAYAGNGIVLVSLK